MLAFSSRPGRASAGDSAWQTSIRDGDSDDEGDQDHAQRPCADTSQALIPLSERLKQKGKDPSQEHSNTSVPFGATSPHHTPTGLEIDAEVDETDVPKLKETPWTIAQRSAAFRLRKLDEAKDSCASEEAASDASLKVRSSSSRSQPGAHGKPYGKHRANAPAKPVVLPASPPKKRRGPSTVAAVSAPSPKVPSKALREQAVAACTMSLPRGAAAVRHDSSGPKGGVEEDEEKMYWSDDVRVNEATQDEPGRLPEQTPSSPDLRNVNSTPFTSSPSPPPFKELTGIRSNFLPPIIHRPAPFVLRPDVFPSNAPTLSNLTRRGRSGSLRNSAQEPDSRPRSRISSLSKLGRECASNANANSNSIYSKRLAVDADQRHFIKPDAEFYSIEGGSWSTFRPAIPPRPTQKSTASRKRALSPVSASDCITAARATKRPKVTIFEPSESLAAFKSRMADLSSDGHMPDIGITGVTTSIQPRAFKTPTAGKEEREPRRPEWEGPRSLPRLPEPEHDEGGVTDLVTGALEDVVVRDAGERGSSVRDSVASFVADVDGDTVDDLEVSGRVLDRLAYARLVNRVRVQVEQPERWCCDGIEGDAERVDELGVRCVSAPDLPGDLQTGLIALLRPS